MIEEKSSVIDKRFLIFDKFFGKIFFSQIDRVQYRHCLSRVGVLDRSMLDSVRGNHWFDGWSDLVRDMIERNM